MTGKRVYVWKMREKIRLIKAHDYSQNKILSIENTFNIVMLRMSGILSNIRNINFPDNHFPREKIQSVLS